MISYSGHPGIFPCSPQHISGAPRSRVGFMAKKSRKSQKQWKLLYLYWYHWYRYKYGNSWGFCETPRRNQGAADDQWAPLSESTRVRGSRACSKLIRYGMTIEDSRFCETTNQSPNSFLQNLWVLMDICNSSLEHLQFPLSCDWSPP